MFGHRELKTGQVNRAKKALLCPLKHRGEGELKIKGPAVHT